MNQTSLRQPPTAETLVQRLQTHAASRPAARAFTFLRADRSEAATIDFGTLDQRARSIGAALRARGAADGDRVLLAFPPGLEFIEAFFGCLYAALIAVPAYPARSRQGRQHLQRVAQDAEARFLLLPQADLEKCEVAAGAQALAFEPLQHAPHSPLPTVTPDDIAFLQYTSGSTGNPRGVMVTHRALMANQQMIAAAFQHDAATRFVGWLPLYHDMGLIGNVLQPVFLGIPCVLMAPADFLHNPLLWLWAISHYRATTSGAPNFAYELCIRKVTPQHAEQLDLSSWSVAFNGAEPVRASTLERFSAAFAAAGFAPAAFFPCYGLAEATLFVSGERLEQPCVRSFDDHGLRVDDDRGIASNSSVRPLVACGRAWLDSAVRIVDPLTLQEVEDGREGEIWIRGAHVTAGYWKQATLNATLFAARIKDSAEGPFLRSGDLGCMYQGRIFVSGRIKDLLIIRGRNHYPQDLEASASSCDPALQADGTAAFSAQEGGEELVIVQEVVRAALRHADLAALQQRIRSVIAETHGLAARHVLLVKPRSLPRTSSGKIRRSLCRSLWQEGKLESLCHDNSTRASCGTTPATRSETQVQQIVASCLRQPSALLDCSVPLQGLGLDSLMLMELRSALKQEFGLELGVDQLYSNPNVQQLARLIDTCGAASSTMVMEEDVL